MADGHTNGGNVDRSGDGERFEIRDERRGLIWRSLRNRASISDQLAAYYDRLMAAEERLEQLRIAAGVSEEDFDNAQVLDPETGEEESEDLARLANAVRVLGGHLEINAVLPQGTVRLFTDQH